MIMGNLLYNALPYIYTAGGVTTLLVSAEPIGRVSGILLISAAMLVFHLRLEYRSKRADEAEVTLTATRMAMAKAGGQRNGA